jgi:hypothetical protein
MKKTLEDKVRQFLGISPYDSGDMCCGDGIFLYYLNQEYGKEEVNKMIIKLKKENKQR